MKTFSKVTKCDDRMELLLEVQSVASRRSSSTRSHFYRVTFFKIFISLVALLRRTFFRFILIDDSIFCFSELLALPCHATQQKRRQNAQKPNRNLLYRMQRRLTMRKKKQAKQPKEFVVTNLKYFWQRH